jgi:hypothetical protein
MLWWVLLRDYCSCFHICRRPLKFDRISMPAYHRHLSQVSLPFFSEFVHHQNCPLSLSNRPGGCCSDLHQHTISVTVFHIFELHDTSMGHARLVCTQFIFHTLRKVGYYRFPSPSNGSLLILSFFLFLTIVLSVEETLMNFGYTYAPNLIHQGAFVITEISSANGYRNPTSSNSY